MKNLLMLAVLFTGLFLASCNKEVEEVSCDEVTTDQSANLEQFAGLWYEVASFPQVFTPGCECTTAQYTIKNDGKVEVFNKCKSYGFFPIEIKGEAYPEDPADFSKLLVKFPVSPTAGEYWIMEFSENYMLVGNSRRDNLYFLSRTPVMDEEVYQFLVQSAADQCFDISKIKRTNQDCYRS